MVIKTVLMGIPVLVSRSGFTRRRRACPPAGHCGRRGARFIVLSGPERLFLIIWTQEEEEEKPCPTRLTTRNDSQINDMTDIKDIAVGFLAGGRHGVWVGSTRPCWKLAGKRAGTAIGGNRPSPCPADKCQWRCPAFSVFWFAHCGR